MSTRAPALILMAAAAAGCGGGGPTDPGGDPTPVPGSAVSGFVFYDENGNGTADAAEAVRLPGVAVAIGGATGSTSAGGRFSLPSVPNGSQTAQARPESLPAYFAPGAAVSISVPPTGDVAVPAVLAITEPARANVYLAFGDSITSDGSGWDGLLESDLRASWGKATVERDGAAGTKSSVGAARLGTSLSHARPAYVLILYGTNDWNEPECREEFPCFTITALRSMVLQARDRGAVAVVGTIPPVNPAYADRNPEARNAWVTRMNEQVRAMARQERVPIAEVHGEFLKQASLPELFDDFLHPNDAGFRAIARSFFSAVTQPLSASGSFRPPSFFLRPFGGR
jgi:lysophospholipase L1-like esterase